SFIFLLYALFTKSKFRLPDKKDLLPIFILGVIGISFCYFGVTFGELMISAGSTSMFVGSVPLFTTLIALFILRVIIALYGWVGLGIGFIGIVLITIGSTGETFSFSTGLFLVFFATISTSFFFVYQKPLLLKYDPIHLTAYFTWAG